MADTGGEIQAVSHGFDREVEAFDFYLLVKSEEMTFDDAREVILPTAVQRADLLEGATGRERENLLLLFAAREETWRNFERFMENPEFAARWKKKWDENRRLGSLGAKGANRHKKKKRKGSRRR